jgi:hypothetical protein
VKASVDLGAPTIVQNLIGAEDLRDAVGPSHRAREAHPLARHGPQRAIDPARIGDHDDEVAG